jgi:aryl-phospho-beta-D-glucosidase BglC (GH1 family)
MLGVTLVRLSLNPQHWQDYAPTIDKIVSLLEQRQIYVMLDFHEVKEGESYDDINNVIVNKAPVGPFPNWIEFVKTLATRYKDHPNAALIQFFGQPPHATDAYPLKTLEETYYNGVLEAARAIHAINPNVLVTFGSVNSDHISQMFMDKPLPEPNIVYALHRYYHFDLGWSDYAKSYASGQLQLAKQQMESLYRDIGFAMLDKGFPILLVEFGADTLDPNWDTQVRDLYALLARYGVGWTQWAYSADNVFAVTSDGSTLSPQGQLWAESLIV